MKNDVQAVPEDVAKLSAIVGSLARVVSDLDARSKAADICPHNGTLQRSQCYFCRKAETEPLKEARRLAAESAARVTQLEGSLAKLRERTDDVEEAIRVMRPGNMERER